MPYCDISDLVAKVDIDKLINLGKVTFPDNLKEQEYDDLFAGLNTGDKAFVDSIYVLINEKYALSTLSIEEKKKFLIIYSQIENLNTIENAIAGSGQLIDGYLSARYPVPLNPVPDNIKIFSVNITIAELLIDAGVNNDSEADKAIIKRKDEALKFLEKVAAGTFNLPVKTDTGESVKPADDFIAYKSKPKLDMRGFI
jgi:phage gp36-like protein